MVIVELILEGFTLMLLGMGSVFSFLVILFLMLVGVTRIVRFIEHEEEYRCSSSSELSLMSKDRRPVFPTLFQSENTLHRRSLD